MDDYTPQYLDRNVSPKEYRKFPENSLLVRKIWPTIQGEGPFAGQRAVFIRLAGCDRGAKTDMGCAFCDADFRFDSGLVMSFDLIAHEIEIMLQTWMSPDGEPLIVITGGEPMMQDNLAGFCQFLLDKTNYEIQIESNGDRIVENFPDDVMLVVSPKQVGGEYRTLRALNRANALKVLVDARNSYRDLPPYLEDFSGPVYVQPVTVYLRPPHANEVATFFDPTLVDLAATYANYRLAASYCTAHGYRLSSQTHLLAGVP